MGREGQAVDVFSSEYRDSAAATRFVARAIKRRGIPQKIILGGYAASYITSSDLREEGILPATLRVRTNRYLNNLIEQDHRRGKQCVRPVLGDHATATITGIELVHEMKKGQFNVMALGSQEMRTPQVWEAVLAA